MFLTCTHIAVTVITYKRNTLCVDLILKKMMKMSWLLLEGPLEGKVNRGRPITVDDKYHRLDGNAPRRPRETVSRSGAMESHDSQPSSRRRHLMMMMMNPQTLEKNISRPYMPYCFLYRYIIDCLNI